MRPASPGLLYAGLGVAGAGFALIAFAWGQVAGLESVALQIPYVVSGGLTGLGLVIVGATAVNIHVKRREAAERERQSAQLLEILRQVTTALGVAPPPGEPDADEPDAEDATEDLTWQS